MSPTLLHVVYAGRGDALIVQEDPQVFLIDGGPLGYTAQRHSGAPYWRYYYSAVEEVSRAANPQLGYPKPSAVIVSHAHEDHYGGIAGVFDQFLSPLGVPAGNRNLVFDGPLITQALPLPDDPEVSGLVKLLAQFGFKRALPQPRSPVARTFTFAARPRRWTYRRKAAVLPARVWSVDASPANVATVLMTHRATGMAFTGDSVGYLIVNFLDAIKQTGTMPIFKVPHHGSMRNSQRAEALADVPAPAWKQYALLCIASPPTDWDELRMPSEVQDGGAVATALDTLEEACVIRGIDLQPLRRSYRRAFNQTMAKIKARDPDPFVLEDQGTINGLWHAVVAELNRRQFNTRASASDTPTKKLRLAQDPSDVSYGWYAKLAPTRFSDVFSGELAGVQLRDFFTRVVARNYVISADGRHAHPGAETIAALATVASGRGAPVRVLVTDGHAVDLDRVAELEPSWGNQLELRYLARGTRMVLNPTHPGPIGEFDPRETTKDITTAATLPGLHAQFQRNRGATIPMRFWHTDRYNVKARDHDLFLRLDADGEIVVDEDPQDFYVDQAWTLALTNFDGLFFPASFDDVRLRVAEPPPDDSARLVTLIDHRDPQFRISAISIQDTGQRRLYVCSNRKTGFLTPDPGDPRVLGFEFVLADQDREQAARPVEEEVSLRAFSEADEEVSLRAFCEEVGVPTLPPPSCAGILPELVGPIDAGVLDEQIRSRLVNRALAWDANLDGSTVTYRTTASGPLVTAAEIAVELGTERDFLIDSQAETIATARMTLGRDEASGALAMGANVTTADGTLVWDGAEDAKPTESRSLDQYLYALGMDPASRPNLTAGTLLTAIAGDEPAAEALLFKAPSPIVNAGIGEWLLDHEASEVETYLTTTGAWTELRAARLVLRNPAAIEQEVAGLSIVFSTLALTVADARLPTMEVVLEAMASAAATDLTARAVLSDEGCATQLSLPEGSDLAALLRVLPSAAAGIDAMKVPLADAPLSSLPFAAPRFEVTQPSLGAAPYELAAAAGEVEFAGWREGLPGGWPAPLDGGTATVQILDPLDAEHRGLSLEVDFEVEIGPWKIASVLRAEPLPAPAEAPAWAHTVGLHPDPVAQPLTATEALGALGLGSAGDALIAQLPALAPVLGKATVSLLTVVLAQLENGSEVERIDLGLVTTVGWQLLPGIARFGLAQVALIYMNGRWSAEVEGDAAVGIAGAVGASARLSTPELAGSISFENTSDELTASALAKLCGGADLAAIPLLGERLGEVVDMVELALPPAPAPGLAGFGFSAGAEPIEAGVLTLAEVGLRALVSLEGGEGPGPWTGYWLEGRWGEDLVATLSYDEMREPAELPGTLQPVPEEVPLGGVLERLLGEAAESTLLAAVKAMALREGTFVMGSKEFELRSCSLDLKSAATLPVAAATASGLRARWSAAEEAEKEGEEETPEVYVLEGTLARDECKYEAELEVQFRNTDETTTVAGTIRALPPAEEEEEEEEAEANEFTVATLLELLGLERPQVLTPDGAPEFFELEPTSVEAVFSVEPFQLEALTILVVEEDESFPLLPQPQPIELEKLSLRVEYEREPEEGEASIRGVVLGDLPLQPQAVTLAYTEPEGEQAAFRAKVELEEKDAPDYRRLIGTEPYDPGYGLPEGLEIPVAIPMTMLTVTARPDEYVDLRGHDEGTTWEAQVERLELNVGALGGSVKVTPGATTEAPHEFALSLFGRLEYHGFVGTDAVLRWGPESRSLLSASATDEVGEIEVSAIAEDLGLRWREQVPTETPDFAFAAAWTYADLTDPTAPSFGLYGDGALGPVNGTAALLSRIVPTGLHADFLFGAEAEGAFPLQPLWQQLGEIVDGYLDLASGNLAVLVSEESGAEVEEDLAALLEIAADQSPEYTPPFADLPPLAEALPGGTRLGAGLSVLASVDADAEGSLNRALTEIAKPETLPLLLAWGLVDPQGPERSRFEVDLAGLVVFDGAISVDAVAEYAPSEAEALLAPQATGHVEVDASPYDFPGGLTIEAEAATFASDDGKGPTIVAPFGATGADLRDCALSATYRYPPGKAIEGELRIVGFVDLEVEEKRQDEEENDESGLTRGVTCEGAIEFAAGTAVVVVFALPGSMQATDFYANAMTGGAWPAGYRSFGLTQPRFHAARETVTIEATEYPAGYHALGTTRFLRHQFEIDVAIEKEGLRAGGASATAIDFTYLLLAEPDVGLFTGKSSSEPPPEPPSFRAGGAAEIFHGAFGRLDFSFDPALKGWIGLATYDKELVGVPVPEVLFSYTAEGGLRLVDWPLRPSLDEEELDWEEELEEASEGGECGKLEDLGLDEGENEDKTTETSFELSMEQVGELEGDTLSVVLSGQYTVTVKSSEGERSTTMAFPDTPGTIAPASSFQLGQLEDWVKETIQSNREELGKSLLEERDVEGEPGLESFLEEFGFEAAEAELIERLLCREDGPKKVRTRAEHIVEETEEKATKKLKEAEDELEEVEISTTISVLFAFLITFFAWITIVFQWIVFLGGPSFFGGLIGRIWPWLPPGRREEWEELVTKSQEAEAEGERVRGWVATTVLAMRGFPDVAFFDRTTVEVSWDADNLPSHEGIDYEEFLGFSFEVEVATDPGFESVAGRIAVPFPVTTAQLANPIWGVVNSAFGRVRAVYEGIPGSWIGGQAFHKVQLPAPEPVTQALDPAAGELTVTATAVPYAASYTFELLDTLSGMVVATRDVATPPPSPATIAAVFTAADLPSSGGRRLLLGRARAIGDEIAHEDSPFASAPQSEAVTTLPPPELNPPKLGPEGIGVTWSAVAGAAGYAVRVLDSQGRELSPQPDAAVAELGCVLSGEGLSDGAQLQVEARAFAAGAIGSWSAPASFTVQALSPPTDLQALYFWPEDKIQLSWKGPVSSYQVEVVDAGGQRLSPKVEFSEGAAATLTGPGIGPERDYRIRVRRTPSGRPAIWGSWLPLASEALAPPAEPRLEYRHRAFWASWRPIPGAGGYPIELEGPGGTNAVEVPESPAIFPVGGGLEPHLGDDFHAKIRAVVGANVTDYAIVEGPVPPLLKVAIDDWDEEVACQEAARECRALEPKLRAAQLWDTLVAGGYSSREASRAVVAVLPGTTPAKLEAISGALADRGRMIALLTEESVPAAVVVALSQALYSPVPVQLLVLLKELKFSSAGLAAIFVATLPLSGAEATVLFAAVFTEPWCLGAVFATERQDCEDAAALLRRAYPPSLPLAASLAALNAAAYGEAELRQAFPVSAQEWDPAWTAVRGDATGVSLAKALQAATVSRNDAAGYVISCWPQLSKAELKEAIERAYGP